MSCPYCAAPTTTQMARRTTLGYRMFHCRACRRTCNERTGTPFNHLQVPTDSAVLVVLWRLQYKLSLRNVAEMVLTRGFTVTHETAPAWEERLVLLLTARLKARRRGKAGRTWHVDETCVKVEGRWCYLYRAIDSAGTLVETMLSKTRDRDAAKRFFACALKTVGQAPEKAPTDGHDSYPRAVRETLGPDVSHRTSRYMNNRIEQDHPRHQATLLPHAGVRLLQAPPPVSVRRLTSYAIISAPAPTSMKPSPSPTNAASSSNAGVRCARCCRQPSRRRAWSTPAYRRLPHLCVLKPDASGWRA